VKRNTPGGKKVIRYERHKPSKAKCGGCKKPLSGVPTERKIDMMRLGKTKKRPERAYGGVLCHKCLKIKIKDEKVYKTEA
jgi:large subunit ribosomal protein L34e